MVSGSTSKPSSHEGGGPKPPSLLIQSPRDGPSIEGLILLRQRTLWGLNKEGMMKQVLVLFRGLPGSGKTTAAKLWSEGLEFGDEEVSRCIYAADDFFEERTGYDFDARLLSVAHSQCILRTYECLKAGHSVGVHNTFTTKQEMQPYLFMAESLEVPVRVIHCTGEWKNIHNVPQTTLNAMRARWEDFKGEEEV